MKVIEQLSVPKEVNSDFPFGAIINETDTEDGTPVVREIYNDLLVNCYKILALAGITPNGGEDNETSGYQLVEAIRNLPNLLNDVEQSLSLSATVWSVNLKFSLLPNKYVFFAKASENYNDTLTYTIKGSEANPIYNFTSPTGFNANDELVLVLDTTEVKAYSLNSLTANPTEIKTPLGTPIAYNNSSKVYYFEDGTLMSDTPSANYIDTIIKTDVTDSTVIVLNAFILKGKLLCFCYSDANERYFFYQFDMSDLSTGTLVTYTISTADNFSPYCYTDGTFVYLTNDANTESDDFLLRKLNYNEATAVITNNSTITLESSFVKTTNVVMKSNALISLVGGVLNSFNLGSSTKTELGVYNANSGNIFVHNSDYYHGVDVVATKWNL